MRKRRMWTLECMVLAMALIGVMATGAQADLSLFTSGSDLPPGNPDSEVVFVEGITGEDLTLLDSSLFDVSVSGSTADISWDLSGTGEQVNWVLVVDGSTQGADGKLFNLYEVVNGQEIIGGDTVVCCDGIDKNVSHITFLGGPGGTVPEPTTLVLLGVGLMGAALVRRKVR